MYMVYVCKYVFVKCIYFSQLHNWKIEFQSYACNLIIIEYYSKEIISNEIDTFVCDMIVRKLTINYSYLNKKYTFSLKSIYTPLSIMNILYIFEL